MADPIRHRCLPPLDAIIRAWDLPGTDDDRHRRAQAEVRRLLPDLAAELDRELDRTRGGLPVPAEIPPPGRAYPVSDNGETDPRFDLGLVLAVATALADSGYPDLTDYQTGTDQDEADLSAALHRYIYGAPPPRE
jgi:hypothetical protein